MKKLITVCWSTSLEVDIPDNATIDDLSDGCCADIGRRIISQAMNNVDLKLGVITDIQEPYDESADSLTKDEIKILKEIIKKEKKSAQ